MKEENKVYYKQCKDCHWLVEYKGVGDVGRFEVDCPFCGLPVVFEFPQEREKEVK